MNLRNFIDHYYIIIFVGIDRSVLIFDYFSPLIVPTSVKKKNNVKRRMKLFLAQKYTNDKYVYILLFISFYAFIFQETIIKYTSDIFIQYFAMQ